MTIILQGKFLLSESSNS